ncbi:SAM-dependent methyltransferase [Streptomyces sp. SBT349]|uniref:SAM-dependent methyltransferase n=1 Tax=Streptomyces sp. SBT349 TaxID=1580539 RepID=UPI000A9014DC
MDGDTRVNLRTDQPHAARMYDYLLGGRDHYAADGAAVERALAAFPMLRTAAQENRAFLGRAVRYLVREAGIRQFIDLGSGMPTSQNVHQIAQGIEARARVVYVDNDPIVLAFGGAMLAQDERTAVVRCDIREPGRLLGDPTLRACLDLTQPIGVLAVGVLHFVEDRDDPAGIVRTFAEAAAPGSHVVLSHATADLAHDPALGVQAAYREQGVPLTLRDSERFGALFGGLDLVEPGVETVSEWRPTVPRNERPDPAHVSWYGGVGRVP